MAKFFSETPRKFWRGYWQENVYIVGRQTYEVLKISVNSVTEATQFLRLSMYWQNAFENLFGRERFLGSRKDNPSMADFQYNNNAIANQKNSVQLLMIMLLIVAWLPKLRSHFHVENRKKNERLNVNLEQKSSSTAACPKLKQNTS